MTRHRNQRIYIGPKTNEVIISLSRSYGVDFSEDQKTKIEFSRRGFPDAVVSIWTDYTVVKNQIHFEPPSEFLTNITDFPKGFYDGKVFVGDCHIEDMELVKAPGHYVSKVDSIQDSCKATDWVEPDCLIIDPEKPTCNCSCNGDPEEDCECIYKVKNNCPTCYNETFNQLIDVENNYVDWDAEEDEE